MTGVVDTSELALCQVIQLLALEEGGDVFEELIDLGLGDLLAICFGELEGDAFQTVTDEGGHVLHLEGAWLEGVAHTVLIEGQACYSGRAGEGMAPLPHGGLLRAVTPADLPVGGPYDIVVSWGGDAPGEVTLPSLVSVVRRVRRTHGYDLPAMFPAGAYARGYTQLDEGPILAEGVESLARVDLLRAVLSALAETLAEFCGVYFTRLRAPLPPALAGAPVAGSDTAQVESTYGWPDSGTVVILGETITYASKTDITLEELGRDDSVSVTYPEGTPVVIWTRDRSALDQARRGIFVETAEEGFLDVVGGNVGVPRYLDADDELYRRMIRALAYLPGKGSPAAIDIFLDLILEGRGLTSGDGTITNGNEISSIVGGFTAGMVGARIRLYSDNTHIYRIAEVTDDQNIVLDTQGHIRWRGANLDDDTPVRWEVLPWDVHADPWAPGVAVIILAGAQPDGPEGFAYLQGGEVVMADDTTHVTTNAPIRQVLGVWLATDTERTGTNYATNNNFLGNVITLNTALPGVVNVMVDYGSVTHPPSVSPGVPGSATGAGTAQLLKGVAWRNPVGASEVADEGYAVESGAARYPLYLGDRVGYILALLDIVLMAGIRPEIRFFLW